MFPVSRKDCWSISRYVLIHSVIVFSGASGDSLELLFFGIAIPTEKEYLAEIVPVNDLLHFGHGVGSK